MKPLARLALGVSVLAGATFVASAQTVISAKSGLIHYAEGSVYLGDQQVENKFGSFPEVKENQQLRTEQGRAEVLLTPGVFLRLGESSAVRMITNRLIDTRVDFLSGSILVEAADMPKDNGVTIVYKDYAVRLEKKGLYRFDSEPAELRVYDGEASATLESKTEQVKEGHLLAFNGDLKLAKFNKDDTDALYRWSLHRSEYLAMANVSAAKSLQNSGGGYGYYGGGWGMNGWGMNGWGMTGMGLGGWYFNPFFDMYTFVPYNGICYSPFGFAYWSPFTVYNAFMPYYGTGFYRGGGAAGGVRNTRGITSATSARTTVARTSSATRSGLSGTMASSGGGRSVSTAASSSANSGVSRSGGFGGGGGGFGGGGHAGGGHGR